VLAGTTLSQLLTVLALGASLHAVGQRASLATLITVTTLAAIVGGAVPVSGGAGVVEAGMIAGLTAAGILQDQAVAAVLIQRLFTAYLPRSGAGPPWPGCAAANTSDANPSRVVQEAAGAGVLMREEGT
jgi:uncharacterized membrane protein YbhN (UPF0104 family)